MTAPKQLPEASVAREPTEAVELPFSKLVSFWQAMKRIDVNISSEEIFNRVFMKKNLNYENNSFFPMWWCDLC
jgi:hypothetical protein